MNEKKRTTMKCHKCGTVSGNIEQDKHAWDGWNWGKAGRQTIFTCCTCVQAVVQARMIVTEVNGHKHIDWVYS